MGISEAREEKQKRYILEATIKAVALAGLDNVTMQSIASTAGLSKGGLTHYYSSKQELFLAAFPYFFTKVVAECKANADSYNAPIDRLLSFDMIFNIDHPLLTFAHPVLHDFMSVAAHNQLYRDIYHKWVETWVDLIRIILKEGCSAGSFKCSDIDSTARTISAIIHGIATRTFLAPQTHPCEWAARSYREAALKLLDVRLP